MDIKPSKSKAKVTPDITPGNSSASASGVANSPIKTETSDPTISKTNIKRDHVSVEKRLKNARHSINKTNRSIFRHINKFLIARWDHLKIARRKITIWLILIVSLISISIIQTIQYSRSVTSSSPSRGGVYAEGVVDKLTTINPLYASTDSEKAVSQLIYPGLLSYDSSNHLSDNLAESWSVDKTGKIWDIKLKLGLKWSDGKPLTTKDVAFTLNLMKDSNIGFPGQDSWKTITASIINEREIKFNLTSPYMPFESALTFGILPEHALGSVAKSDVNRLVQQSPEKIVGAGPFIYSSYESHGQQNIWHFNINNNYYGTKPKVSQLTVRTYPNNNELISGIKRGEINSASGVQLNDINGLNQAGLNISQVTTADGVFAMFNQSGEFTSQKSIRDALRLATNRQSLRKDIVSGIKSIENPPALETPITTGVYKSIDELSQPQYNLKQAEEILDKAGWKKQSDDQYRMMNNRELEINMVSIKGTNYESIARLLADQWKKLGVKVNITEIDPGEAQQNYLIPRAYDVLIYQLHLGTDPDQFAYWSSTQATGTGLNFSNYKSRLADIYLSSGRTSPNPTSRESRYIAFAKQWLKDNPAIALYQPAIYYATSNNVEALKPGDKIIDSSNRFSDISNWSVKQSVVKNTP